MHRRRSLGEGIQQALVGRNARRRRSDCTRYQQRAVDCPHEVIKAKSTVTATTTAAGGASKQRPVFRRGKITDPAICTRNSTSLMSTETSTTFVPEEGVADEDAWYSSDDNYNGSVATAMAVERKVHFRVDDKDEIVTDIVPANTGGRWFQQKKTATSSMTGDDFRQLVIDARTYIARLQSECPEIVEILARMFQDQNLLASGLLSEKDAGLLFAWSSGHGRGLEDHLIVAMRKHRTHTRSSVLMFQEKMASVGCQDYTQALCKRSCMESKKSAAFARIMAIGDALVAESIHLGRTSDLSFIPK